MTRPTSRMAPAILAVFVVLALSVWGGRAEARNAPKKTTCPTGVLNLQANNTQEFPEGADVDLVIAGPCTARRGFTHVFGNVNIVSGGSLIFADATADFWAASILVQNGGALIAGTPDHPIGRDDLGNVVTIHLYGKDQTCVDGTGNPDRTCAAPKQGKGILCQPDAQNDVERCGVPITVWTSNATDDGRGHLGPGDPKTARRISAFSASGYVGPVKDDFFYPYHGLKFDEGVDGAAVGYFGYKVLGVSYGGTLQLFGQKGGCYGSAACTEPSHTAPSWVRLAKTIGPNDPAADQKRLVLSGPVTWKKDDKIVVTTTDYLPGHSEELTVAQDTGPNATTVTVEQQVKYIHRGEVFPLSSVRDGVLSNALKTGGAEVRAAVALLSRNVRIVSEGDFPPTVAADGKITAPGDPLPSEATCLASPSPKCYFGGHVIVRQGFKVVQIQAVEFKQLGQGGRIGHYPIHFHHARRTQNPPTDENGTALPRAPETFVLDSSINESMTRWIVLHGTHDVTLARNVGYKSIGHGFYLEDGTEINNKLLGNLGIFARGAVDNVQNPRKVPGILAAPNLDNVPGLAFPFKSDYDAPTAFWIMNGWNDFQYNMAAGVGTCGACYWLVGGYNSTSSRVVEGRGQRWESYASMQSSAGRGAMTPLKSFIGNSCSTAMTSFQTITITEACQGVGAPNGPDPVLSHVRNPLAENSLIGPVSAPVPNFNYYPGTRDGGRFATRCSGKTGAHDPHADCSDGVMVTDGRGPSQCASGALGDCMITVLDRYTTSFNWAAFNFAAIWLRPQWYLITDSVIADVQQAGLTMVTGGGYSESDVITGHWALVRKSAFIGHTQENNPYASNAGPFNPGTPLLCAYRVGANQDAIAQANYCLSRDEGISIQLSNFGMYQRLFSVYDGPAFQDSNAYLNIKYRAIDDCLPFVDERGFTGRCDFAIPDPNDNTKKIFSRWTDSAGISHGESRWMNGRTLGLPKSGDTKENLKGACYMPNAAIGWKQPNGFYYPPAFHSTNLFFKDVDVRHFVISPLFKEPTLDPDYDFIARSYCGWNQTIFDGFAGNDRQTVLNDDDGSLTGYKRTTVINLDDFFSAPKSAVQCLSDDSSRTSPYDYVTTVLYPQCVLNQTCAKTFSNGDPIPNDGDWNRSCTSEKCYGIPLWRQDEMPEADKIPPTTGQPVPRSIRMMGQNTAQRSTLTVNGGTYYLDTTVKKEDQLKCPGGGLCVTNVFKAGDTYYLFLIFAKENTEQKYQFYVGPGTKDEDPRTALKMQLLQANIPKNPIVFTNFQTLPRERVTWLDTNRTLVEVTLSVSDLRQGSKGFSALVQDAKQTKCKPETYCHWTGTACIDNNPVDQAHPDAVCRWANADIDCPEGGCVGIVFTLPADPTSAPANIRPAPKCLERVAPWTTTFSDPDAVVTPPASPEQTAGACYRAPTHTDDFCPPE